ncbi:GNAT family N-acetyltransferase, partial [bacterium]|nr:GNAT family N-acetyltransferase [bacterium]
APLLIKQQRFKGIPVRKIELIGNVYSPIQTFLFKEMDKKRRKEYISLILQYFSRINNHWDVVDLHSIPEEDGTFPILSNAVKKSVFRSKEYFCFGNWYANGIDYSSDTYFKNRSRNLRASIKKNFKKAQQAGNLHFEMITCSVHIEKYMNSYFELYSRSWKKQERIGTDFYRDLTKQTAEKGWLRLGLVFLDDALVGAGFAIVTDGCAYFEKTAYDEQHKDLGAGSIWLAEMIKYVIDVDKVKVIDVLRGDDDYKKRWFPSRRERSGILVFNNNMKGNLLFFLVQHVLPGIGRSKHLSQLKKVISKKLSASA